MRILSVIFSLSLLVRLSVADCVAQAVVRDTVLVHFEQGLTGIVPALQDNRKSLDIQLRPLVYTYVLIFKIEAGIELVHRACGTLAGMAGTVYLQDGRTGDGKVSVLFDNALVDTRSSTVIAAVHSFGVPGYDYGSRPASSAEEGTFAASIELTLSTGTYIFEADISEQMAGLPRGGVITVQVPEITSEGGDGMFEVSVGDWNHEEVPLSL